MEIRRFLAAFATALAVGGCGVSPQPEPPSIDIQQMHFGAAATLPLIGGKGAVTPGSELVAVNLGNAQPVVQAQVDAQGRFQAPLGGAITDVYRLQAFLDDLHSDPVDVTGAEGLKQGSPAVPASEPLGDCFHLSPALEVLVSPGGSQTVTLTNRCADDVRIEALTVRLGTVAWSVSGALPLVVPAGGAGSFDVALDGSARGDVDDVLIVRIDQPVAGTRALTLLAAP